MTLPRPPVLPRPALGGSPYGQLDGGCPNAIEVRIGRVRSRVQRARATASISAMRGVPYRLALADEAGTAAHGGAPDRPAAAS